MNVTQVPHSLLAEAQTAAAPYTRRVAWQLAGCALAMLALISFVFEVAPTVGILQSISSFLSSLTAWAGSIAAAATSAVTAAEVAVTAAATAVAGTVVSIVAGTTGPYGFFAAFSGALVLNGWYRARRYVMQSAVDLALRNDITEPEGRALLLSFAKTHFRVSTAMYAIGFFAAAQLSFTILAAVGIPSLAGLFSDSGWLAFGWIALVVLVASLPVFQHQLCRPAVTAYALYRSCELPANVFMKRLLLEHSRKEVGYVHVMLVKLQGMGLHKYSMQGLGEIAEQAYWLDFQDIGASTGPHSQVA